MFSTKIKLLERSDVAFFYLFYRKVKDDYGKKLVWNVDILNAKD